MEMWKARHVAFGYDPSHMIIHDFNMKVKEGQKVAIVGSYRSGKDHHDQAAHAVL